jgi:hypothetical protein
MRVVINVKGWKLKDIEDMANRSGGWYDVATEEIVLYEVLLAPTTR